ncbi:MAG: cupin domain-containing protein [Pseudomonadota bacterium]
MPDAYAPLVRRPGPGEPAGLLGLPRLLTVPFEATGGALGIWEKMVARGVGASLHRHPREYEVLVVIEGAVSVLCGTTRVEAESGTVVVIPPGAPHAYEGARAESPSCVLFMLVPALGANVVPLGARRGAARTGEDYSMELLDEGDTLRAANDDD